MMKHNVVCRILENLVWSYIRYVLLVENLAYQKSTWTNDRTNDYERLGLVPRSARLTNGNSSFAIDGDEGTLEWSKCTTIDNYFVEKPIWMVDLGRRRNIAGVILKTWSRNSGNLNRDFALTKKENFS